MQFTTALKEQYVDTPKFYKNFDYFYIYYDALVIFNVLQEFYSVYLPE